MVHWHQTGWLRRLPGEKGRKAKDDIGPLHIQCNQQGERKYLNQLVHDVLSWPYIEPTPKSLNHRERVSIRLQATAATNDYSAFIRDTEFAEVLLGAPTIVMVLPWYMLIGLLLKSGLNRTTCNLSAWCRLVR